MTVSLISVIPLAIAAFIVVRLFMRIMSNRKGAKYSVRAIFLTPVVYVILTVYFLLGLSVIWDCLLVVAIVVGACAGLLLGRRSELFEKDGKVLYRRSIEVMALWIIGFVARIAVDFIYNPIFNGALSANAIATATGSAALVAYASNPVVIGADFILAFSAGLLLGEAIVLYRNHRSRYGSRANSN